jgi:hypothetical protein
VDEHLHIAERQSGGVFNRQSETQERRPPARAEAHRDLEEPPFAVGAQILGVAPHHNTAMAGSAAQKFDAGPVDQAVGPDLGAEGDQAVLNLRVLELEEGSEPGREFDEPPFARSDGLRAGAEWDVMLEGDEEPGGANRNGWHKEGSEPGQHG